MSIADSSPDWFSALRDRAREAAVDAPVPADTEEVWRYSRIGKIDLDSYRSPSAPQSDIPAVEPAEFAALVTVRDGWITNIEKRDLGGATVEPLARHADGEKLYSSVRGEPRDALAVRHDALLGDPVVIDVPARTDVDQPIIIDVYSDVDRGVTAPHTIVRVGRGSSVAVLERRRSGSADQLTIPVVEIDAAADSRVGYQVIQQLGDATTSFEEHSIEGDQQSHVVSAVAAFGGWYARTRADFKLVGRGASGDLLAAYFADGDQMLDFRTFQEHAAPDTTSNLLFKGAITGSARSVYTGLIRVDETAPGTNAFQTNRNLKLSDDAWAYSVPNLEIEQNQVSCSHASTVGEIDDDQRFYLESRGVPTDMAEQLLVSGFFADVIDQMPVDAVKAELQATIDAALAADRLARGDRQ